MTTQQKPKTVIPCIATYVGEHYAFKTGDTFHMDDTNGQTILVEYVGTISGIYGFRKIGGDGNPMSGWGSWHPINPQAVHRRLYTLKPVPGYEKEIAAGDYCLQRFDFDAIGDRFMEWFEPLPAYVREYRSMPSLATVYAWLAGKYPTVAPFAEHVFQAMHGDEIFRPVYDVPPGV